MRRNSRPTHLGVERIWSCSTEIWEWNGVDQVPSGDSDPETIGLRLFTVLLIEVMRPSPHAGDMTLNQLSSDHDLEFPETCQT